MSNDTPALPDELELKHHDAAEALGKGQTVRAAAAAAGVSESTVLRWKRHERFRDLVDDYKPASQIQRAIDEKRGNFDLISEARDAEILLTVELRDTLERVIKIIKQRLESMTEAEIDSLAIRHLSPLLKCFADGINILQASHDRLTGYGMLIKQLEQILESHNAQS